MNNPNTNNPMSINPTNPFIRRGFDPKHETFNILCDHTNGFMSGAHCEPQSMDELMGTMIEETSYILTQKLVDGDYSPMEYNMVRNELAETIYSMFSDYTLEQMYQPLTTGLTEKDDEVVDITHLVVDEDDNN